MNAPVAPVAVASRPTLKPALLVLLALLSAFTPLSIDMYLPAFPTIQKYFATDPGAIQLTLAAFFVAFACGQVIYGPLTDRFGRKPLLTMAALLFAISSIGNGLADTFTTFILWRIFGGIAIGLEDFLVLIEELQVALGQRAIAAGGAGKTVIDCLDHAQGPAEALGD